MPASEAAVTLVLLAGVACSFELGVAIELASQ